MPSVVFEPTISADERPKTYALDRAATGTGVMIMVKISGPPYKLQSLERQGGKYLGVQLKSGLLTKP
jgi:hypothetical protein